MAQSVPAGFGQPTNRAGTVNYGTDLDGVTDLSPTMAEASGLHMLAQALVRRLITPRGTLIDDANYGYDIRDFLGDDLSPADVGRIGSGVDQELIKDERVLSSQTTVTPLSTYVLTISTVVTPSQGPSFQLVAAVSAVTVTLLQPTQ